MIILLCVWDGRILWGWKSDCLSLSGSWSELTKLKPKERDGIKRERLVDRKAKIRVIPVGNVAWTCRLRNFKVHLQNIFSRLRFNSVVVQDWYQSVPVLSTLKPDPYPHAIGGQTLGTHWSCPTFPLHIHIIFCELLWCDSFLIQLEINRKMMWPKCLTGDQALSPSFPLLLSSSIVRKFLFLYLQRLYGWISFSIETLTH